MSLRSKLSGDLAKLAEKLFAGGEYKTMADAEKSAINLRASNKAGAGAIERAEGIPSPRQFPDSKPMTAPNPIEPMSTESRVRMRDIADDGAKQIEAANENTAQLPVETTRTLRDSNIGKKALGFGAAGAVASLYGDNSLESPGYMDEGADFRGAEAADAEPVGKPAAAPTLRGKLDSSSGIGPVANADLYGKVIEKKPESSAPTSSDYKQAPVSDKDLRDAVSRYTSEIGSLKSIAADTSAIDQEVKDLRAEYKQARTQNEKNELYQLIASSIAKLGAFRWGAEHGQVIGDKLDIPTIDYGKRTDQSFKEMGAGVDEASSRRKSLVDRADKESAIALDKMKEAGRSNIGVQETIYKQKTDRAQDLDRYNREKALLKLKPDGTEDKQAALIRSEGSKQVDDARKRLDQVEPLDKALNGLIRKGDLNQTRELATSIGMSPEDISKTEDPGGWSDWTGSEEKKKNLLLALRKQIDAMKRPAEQEMQDAISLRQHGVNIPGRQEASGSPATAPRASSVSREQLQEYMKQYNMDEKSARNYLEKNGHKVD